MGFMIYSNFVTFKSLYITTVNYECYVILLKTRNTVSNAHKMIPPAPPCFVWQSHCFALGNPKIIRIKT